ncbi:MAG: hypothetical protein KDB07_05840, partial [Planctomycetes bacterium]|nr:hypothetical protein [Planctomycetota bacterium]
MKRNWWVVTFVLGLVSAGFIGWRVFSQRDAVERAQLANRVQALKETVDAKGTQRSFKESSHWRALANQLKKQIGDAKDSSPVHHRNLPAFAYWQGLAEYRAATMAIDEALGKNGNVADPRPETYLNAVEVLKNAVDNPNFDVPNIDDAEDFNRFKDQLKDDFLIETLDPVERRDRVLSELGMVVTKDDEGNHKIANADPFALARIGVQVQKTRKDSDGLDVVAIGEALPKRQIDFLAHRMLVAEGLRETNDRLALRFIEMNRPEYTWQFLSVLVQDQKFGSKFILRSTAGSV